MRNRKNSEEESSNPLDIIPCYPDQEYYNQLISEKMTRFIRDNSYAYKIRLGKHHIELESYIGKTNCLYSQVDLLFGTGDYEQTIVMKSDLHPNFQQLCPTSLLIYHLDEIKTRINEFMAHGRRRRHPFSNYEINAAYKILGFSNELNIYNSDRENYQILSIETLEDMERIMFILSRHRQEEKSFKISVEFLDKCMLKDLKKYGKLKLGNEDEMTDTETRVIDSSDSLVFNYKFILENFTKLKDLKFEQSFNHIFGRLTYYTDLKLESEKTCYFKLEFFGNCEKK